LTHFEVPKNNFTDAGFEVFAKQLACNVGIRFLDISKNKDITDEGSLIALAESLVKNKTLKTLDLSGLKIRKPFLKLHLEPALHRNIIMQQAIGKLPPNIIDHELETNIVIEKEIISLYSPIAKIKQGMFNLRLVEIEENMSRLDLKDKPNRLIKPSFKFIKYYNIRSVDFTNVGFHDEHMGILAAYLRRNPNLRSVVLNGNPFTDEGFIRLATELKTNTKLAHLSIKGC
jgi:Ran GTPase-activating protein (RanGAP) involved in mRNA processing and transport